MQARQSEPARGVPARSFTYWREIGALLCLKAAGLGLLYALFFAPAGQPIVTDQVVARHLLTTPGFGANDEVMHHDR
jgi:hypothetical protein